VEDGTCDEGEEAVGGKDGDGAEIDDLGTMAVGIREHDEEKEEVIAGALGRSYGLYQGEARRMDYSYVSFVSCAHRNARIEGPVELSARHEGVLRVDLVKPLAAFPEDQWAKRDQAMAVRRTLQTFQQRLVIRKVHLIRTPELSVPGDRRRSTSLYAEGALVVGEPTG
jgi:hypothetical protein